MSPEAPGNLVVLDIRREGGELACRVERYDPVSAVGFLRVSWNAIARPPGYEPIAGGVAYVDAPTGYDHRSYDARPDAVGDARIGWIDKVFGDGLMLIAVLPAGLALPGFQDAEPRPVAAKVHSDRMAVYWLLRERTRVTWRMEPAEPPSLPAVCAAINAEAARQERPMPAPVLLTTQEYPPGIRVDDNLDRFYELTAWIAENGADHAQRTFTGVLLAFLVSEDPISRWFQRYVERQVERQIDLGEIVGSKGYTLESLRAVAHSYTARATPRSTKPTWSPSALEVIESSRLLARNVGEGNRSVSLRHVMGAYCFFHFPNHEAQLLRWGFDTADWLVQFRAFLLASMYLSATERAGWHSLLGERAVAVPARSQLNPARRETPLDFLLITALEEERTALLEKLPGFRKLDRDGAGAHTYYEAFVATRRLDKAIYRLIVTSLSGMGPIKGAIKAGAVIKRWAPAHVLVVGIAGGVEGEVAPGDVLVASEVVDYTLGKVRGGSTREERWMVYPADANLLDAAANFPHGWEDLIAHQRPSGGEPARRIGVVASGGDVIASPEQIRIYRADWPKLVGVEMEGGGVAAALHDDIDRPRFLMIRGVSDLADGEENAEVKKRWREYARHVAAAYAVGLLRDGPVEARRGSGA